MLPNNLEINHDIQHKKFFIRLHTGGAFLKYDEISDDVLNFRETRVPEASRHNGVASRLVQHALNYAKRNDKQVVPSCPFVKYFIREHPEYQNVVLTR